LEKHGGHETHAIDERQLFILTFVQGDTNIELFCSAVGSMLNAFVSKQLCSAGYKYPSSPSNLAYKIKASSNWDFRYIKWKVV